MRFAITIFFFQQLPRLTANQSDIAGSFLTSTSQSFNNKFSNEELSTLLCLRYNLDFNYMPTNLPCTCSRKTKITGIRQPRIIDFIFVMHMMPMHVLPLYMMQFRMFLRRPLRMLAVQSISQLLRTKMVKF